MTISRVKISEFVDSLKKYAKQKADAVAPNTDLSLSHAAKLPKDLQDNFTAIAAGKSTLSKKTFVTSLTAHAKKAASEFDANDDGYLSLSEGKKLPRDLQDNFKNFVTALNAAEGAASPGVGKVKDATRKSRVEQHLKEYGEHPVSYRDAFRKGVKAVMVADDPETPREVLKEFGCEDCTEQELTKELKKRFTSMELLPPGKNEESAGDPRADWIFSVKVDTGTDHGFWVSVNRDTGVAEVNGFN